jgi:hypothetical protein
MVDGKEDGGDAAFRLKLKIVVVTLDDICCERTGRDREET